METQLGQLRAAVAVGRFWGEGGGAREWERIKAPKERECNEKAGKMKGAGNFTGECGAHQHLTLNWWKLACSSSSSLAPLLIGIATAIGAVGNEAGNNEPLDLLSTFVNLKNLSVSHQLFYGVLAVVAIPAKNLPKTKGV